MTVIFDGRNRSAWIANSNATWDQLPAGGCPYFPDSPILQGTLVDGQRASWDPVANERSDYQQGIGSFPNGSRRCVVWAERFIEIPSSGILTDRWNIAGFQIHGQQVNQPLMTTGLSPTGKRRLETNRDGSPSRAPTYWGNKDVVVGQWATWRIDQKYVNDSSGYIDAWYNGEKIATYTGQTTGETGTGYAKMSLYRNADRNGRIIFQWAGFQIHDTLVDDPWTGGGPTPPPPSVAEPLVSLSSPTQGSLYVGSVPYSVTLSNQPTGYTLYVGLAPSGVSVARTAANAPHTGALTIPAGLSGAQWFYASLHNSSGAKVAEQVFQVLVEPAPTAPPPTPPVVVPPSPPVVQDAIPQSPPSTHTVPGRKPYKLPRPRRRRGYTG